MMIRCYLRLFSYAKLVSPPPDGLMDLLFYGSLHWCTRKFTFTVHSGRSGPGWAWPHALNDAAAA